MQRLGDCLLFDRGVWRIWYSFIVGVLKGVLGSLCKGQGPVHLLIGEYGGFCILCIWNPQGVLSLLSKRQGPFHLLISDFGGLGILL